LSAPAESPTRNTGNDGSTYSELSFGELEINSVDGKAWYGKMKVSGELVDFKLDTGAEANIIPRQQLTENLEQTSEVLSSYGNDKVVPLARRLLAAACRKNTVRFSTLPM